MNRQSIIREIKDYRARNGGGLINAKNVIFEKYNLTPEKYDALPWSDEDG